MEKRGRHVARIAVVEDSPAFREMMERTLKGRGYDVVAFQDGEEALAAIPGGGFDLCISDVQMPRMSGISLCRALRTTLSKTELPVIILSGLDSEDDILLGFDAGANDYLVKPQNPSVLLAKVGLLLRQRQEVIGPAPLLVPQLEQLTPSFPFRFDRYDVEAEVGRGGMGVVYRATDRLDGSTVALKVLDPYVTAGRAGLARFFREVAALSTVSSPRVVRVTGSGFEHGRYYLAMAFVPGRTASDVLTKDGPLPPGQVVRVALDMVEALAALRTQRLVHRDIKPHNVIVGVEGRSTLVDFGLAKSELGDGVTGNQTLMGTPQYIAPEVILGEEATAASDVYGLGVTLFELLTARVPYTGAVPSAVIVEKMGAYRPPPVASVRQDLAPALGEVVDRMLDHDPRRRLADLQDLRQALEAVAT
jgi:CheY-like chemotaxis protein